MFHNARPGSTWLAWRLMDPARRQLIGDIALLPGLNTIELNAALSAGDNRRSHGPPSLVSRPSSASWTGSSKQLQPSPSASVSVSRGGGGGGGSPRPSSALPLSTAAANSPRAPKALPRRPLSATPLRDGKARGGSGGGGGGNGSYDLDKEDRWLHLNRRGPLGWYRSRDRFLESSPTAARVAQSREFIGPILTDNIQLISRAHIMFEVRVNRMSKAIDKASGSAVVKGGREGNGGRAGRGGRGGTDGRGGTRQKGKQSLKADEEEEEDDPLSAEAVYGLYALDDDGGLRGVTRRRVTAKLHAAVKFTGTQARWNPAGPEETQNQWSIKWGRNNVARDRGSLKHDLTVHLPKTEAMRVREEDTRRVMEVLWRHLSKDGLRLILGVESTLGCHWS